MCSLNASAQSGFTAKSRALLNSALVLRELTPARRLVSAAAVFSFGVFFVTQVCEPSADMNSPKKCRCPRGMVHDKAGPYDFFVAVFPQIFGVTLPSTKIETNE